MRLSALGVMSVPLLLAGCSSVVSRPQPFVGTQFKAGEAPALIDGVTYWMPKRDIVVSVMVGADGVSEGTAGGDPTTKSPQPKKIQTQAVRTGTGDPPTDGKKPQDGKPTNDKPADDTPAPPPGNDGGKSPDPEAPKSPTIKIGVTPSYADVGKAYVAHFSRNLIGKNDLTIEVNERGLLSSAKSVTTSQLSDILKFRGRLRRRDTCRRIRRQPAERQLPQESQLRLPRRPGQGGGGMTYQCQTLMTATFM